MISVSVVADTVRVERGNDAANVRVGIGADCYRTRYHAIVEHGTITLSTVLPPHLLYTA